MKYFITLPNGRNCGAGKYAAAWRAILSMPVDASVDGFENFPESAGRVLAKMRAALMDRINRHVRRHGMGRKWDDYGYFFPAWRDSRRLRDIASNVRVYQFETDEAKARFQHLLADRHEQ